ncbi:MAG: M28 family peptidase [Pseudomonadota bacterium]
MRSLILPALLLATPLHAQLLSPEDLERADELRTLAQESALAWELLEDLTVEVGPRMAGSAGDARGVAWGEARFKALGFDRVALEPVTFPAWRRGAERATLVGPYGLDLAVTALGGSVGTPEAGITAPLVRFATLADLDAAPDGSLEGRIAYIGNRMARASDGSGYGPAVQARARGASIAAQKGASALVIRSIGTDDNRTPHTGVMSYIPGYARIPAAAISNPDADVIDGLFDRGSIPRLTLALDVGPAGEYTSHNVIGEIRGSERPEEIVLIGCHLDSWDLGMGVLDDGAGCAVTMAAAKLIREHAGAPSRTIRVVLFANEEQGLWGARAYRDAHLDDLDHHIIGAESDFGAGRIYRFSTRFAPEAFGLADQFARALAPLGIVRGDNNAFGGADISPMRAAGMAVATLHQDGTHYFDYHHTSNDTLDKVDRENLAQNVAAWTVFTWLAAQAPGDFGKGLGEAAAAN